MYDRGMQVERELSELWAGRLNDFQQRPDVDCRITLNLHFKEGDEASNTGKNQYTVGQGFYDFLNKFQSNIVKKV